MKKLVCLSLLLLCTLSLRAEDSAAADDAYPLGIFHNLGNNYLGIFSRNYGANFIGAGLGTWLMIETGADWWWRNIAEDTSWLRGAGMPMLIVGQVVPVITPITLYLTGRAIGDKKLQSTAAALTQALLVTLSIQTPMKMITGRGSTGLYSGRSYQTEEDFSGKFNWFNMDFVRGWPSGHTANAFAAAAVISEMYSDLTLLKIGVYAYAALMGISMASSVHWLSEVVSGALIGFAVGKTVGRSYARPHERKTDRDVTADFSMGSIGVSFRI